MFRTAFALATLLMVTAAGSQTHAQTIRLDQMPSGILTRSSARHTTDDEAHDDEILSCCSKEGYAARPDAHGPMGVMFNHMHTEGDLTGHRFSLEVGLPVYQRLDGPQLEVDRTIIFGWQKGF